MEELRKEKNSTTSAAFRNESQFLIDESMVITDAQDEKSQQCAELEQRLFEEQQKNAQLAAELTLANDKLNDMEREIAMKTATIDSSVAEVASTTLQPSRAVIAAQLLGIDVQLLDEPQPNEWKQKFEELNIKYLKVKQLYRAEQKVAGKLRRMLKDKEKDATTEELSLMLGDAGQEKPTELSEAVCSPAVQIKLQLNAWMRRRLMEEQVDFELPEEEEYSEQGREKETGASRFCLATRCSGVKSTSERRQLFGGGKGQQKPAALPPTKQRRTEKKKKNGAANTIANVPASGGVFKCPQCPPNKVAFSSAQWLAVHEKRVHGVRQQRCRRQCPECGQRCVDNADLRRHRRTHTGEKPFKCRQCGRGFTQKSNLVDHERLHTGERPYVCPVCQRAFTTQTHLVRHSRVHSGETPYSCRHCARQFSQMGDCRRHEKTCPSQVANE